MFKGLSNLASMMKQAQEIQGKMSEMQESLKSVHVEGEAGAGMVKVVVDGQQQVVSCQIEPSVLESGDRELLEELFVSAANQALEKSREAASSKMAALTEGMNFPGLPRRSFQLHAEMRHYRFASDEKRLGNPA